LTTSLDSTSWLAVKGKAADAVYHDLGIRAGMALTTPGGLALTGAASDAGWYLIVATGFDHRLIQPPVLAGLSAGCEVLTCTVAADNLSSRASGWRNGQKSWSVTYEGEDSPEVIVDGDLPVAFDMIRRDYIARSQAPDAGDLLLDPLFEIAIEIVRNPVAYRPDEPSPAFDGRWVVLESINRTFMQHLFGG
jgi:hypothetical protein